MIINAENMVVGRLATLAAKKALLGEKVDIINCEKAVMSGKKRFLIAETKRKVDMGTFKGPFYPRMADRLVRRIIRGMLPYKQEKGDKAFKRVMCYRGIPKELEGKESISIEGAHLSKIKDTDYMTIADICKKLGGR